MRHHAIALLIVAVTGADAAVTDEQLAEATSTGVSLIVNMEEGPDRGEWPYEGVYRYRGDIPIGYRIGGTGIACLAMALSPGYEADAARAEAVARGIDFICRGVEHPLMSPDYDGGYDVRGWGYTYGAFCLLSLQQRALIPEEILERARTAAAFYVDALQQIEIPRVGGWNYARANGRDEVSPPSSFMTAAALQTLFHAAALGYTVRDDVVTRALDVLEQARAASGEYVYSGDGAERRPDGVPGAIGRMVVCESTLCLAGRRTPADVRGGLDAYLVHWRELDKRRAKSGTHAPPYGVAPYYFFFAHHYAAQAVELLPRRERQVYRERLNDVLFAIRDDAGTWNDRVFERSANYGTSMALLAINMPEIGLPPAWSAGDDSR